jgi:CRISPR/Cas system-associated protein Cas10 (large subunit of type III CRISPR-Cas system)
MRKQVIRDLIKEYLKLEDDNLNKKELKAALKYELSLIIKEDENNITDYLLDGWINNELRTELEEKYQIDIEDTFEGINPQPINIPTLNLKKDA